MKIENVCTKNLRNANYETLTITEFVNEAFEKRERERERRVE